VNNIKLRYFALGRVVNNAIGRTSQRLLLASLLGMTLSVHAQTVRLGQILDMARSSDTQYAAARATAESAREKLPQALAGLLPSANLSYSNKANRDHSSAYNGGAAYMARSAILSVNQPLYRPVNWASRTQAEFQVQLAEQQLALAEQELLLRVSRGYFDVLQAQDDLAAATAQKDALVQQLAQAKRSFEVGTVPITDFNEAQSRHDLAVAQEIASRNDLESKKNALEKFLARPLPPLASLGTQANIELLSTDQQNQLVQQAASSALQVAVARSALRVAEQELVRRDKAHWPTLDLVAASRNDTGVNATPFGSNQTRQNSLGVELNVPIFQGGAVSSRVREAIADQQRAEQELINAERQAELDARQALLWVRSGGALTLALRQALTSSETQLRSTQRGLQVGVRTRVDVLNAEQQLYATRKDLAAARYRTLVSALQLKAAAGVLQDADIRAMDALLTQ